MSLPLIDDVRRHHALEHATVTLLLGRRGGKTGRMVGRAAIDGFYLVSAVPPEEVREAAQEALAALTPDDTSAQSDDSRPGSDLTARELEVLRLLVLGLTDREIADVLFISPRTAQGHVGRIYDKLGVNSRSGAVATALGAGLVAAPKASSHREP